jgi:uncharacterized Zn-binding protein involved in type VI secretion
MKKKLIALCSTAAVVSMAAALLAAPAHAAAPTVKIRPAQLERGADPAAAHLSDLKSKTIVDGDLNLPIAGRSVYLLGESGNGYVVVVERGGDQERWSTLRVGPAGGERVLARGTTPDEVVLASDGGVVAITRSQTRARTKIDVLKVRTGRTYARETFAGAPRVLDILGDYAVVGSIDTGTIGWDLGADVTETITGRGAYAADIGAGRLATFTGDPYDDGCSVVSSLARPARRILTSCDERVQAFSPNGRRIATVHILSDGLGPNLVRERTTRGRLLATYEVGLVFGAVRFESGRALLLDSYGPHRAATVRCVAGSCERASAITETPWD